MTDDKSLYDASKLALLDAMGILPWVERPTVVAVGESSSNEDATANRPVVTIDGQHKADHTEVRMWDADASRRNDVPNQAADVSTTDRVSLPENVTEPQVRGLEIAPESFLILPSQRKWIPHSFTVICSHASGHPSQSYLRNGQPSKILNNFLLGLQSTLEYEATPSFIHRCNIAQIGRTALSDDALEARIVIEHYEPKLLIIMGADAANKLTNKALSLSEWQLGEWSIGEQQLPFFVTPHPHELFEKPLLKKQLYLALLTFSQKWQKPH